jgi:hypothetical protein
MQVLSQISALIVSFVEVFKNFPNFFFSKEFFFENLGKKYFKNLQPFDL